MRDKQKFNKETNSVISASEIGQYNYCSAAWYLQKMGYKPDSPFLEIGSQKHSDLGKIIDKTGHEKKKSNILMITGFILFVISIILLIIEVI
jgi:hypothetical protein